MKKLILILILLLLVGISQAGKIPLKITPKQNKVDQRLQEKLLNEPDKLFKVWIFFTDKEIFSATALKISLESIKTQYSAKAIERRLKRSLNPEPFNITDIPVSRNYIHEIETTGAAIKRQSKWLNAVSAMVNSDMMERIKALPFVAEIKPVAKFVRKPIPIDDSDVEDSVMPETGKIYEDLPDSIPDHYGLYEDLPDSIPDHYGLSYTQLQMINVPLMHYLGYTGEGVLIALFDTGFDLDHPAFDSLNLCDSCKYDFINNDTSVGDIPDTIPNQSSHGTATLSVTASYIDSTLIGVAYNADFMIAKTEIEGITEIQEEEDNWVAAAEWADSLGADVISSSLGYYDWYEYSDLDGQTAIITIAAEAAVSKGIVVVNSAGNEATNSWGYIIPPADGEKVIAVGAVKSDGVIAYFSSYGPTSDGRLKPDVVAMGFSVFTAQFNSDFFTNKNGTSFSAPAVAGAAALLLEIHPDWNPLQVKEALISTADRYNNPDTVYGYGLIDTYKAADLFQFNPINSIVMVVGDTLDLDIAVSGVDGIDLSEINITGLNLPPNCELNDLGDGIAHLYFVPTEIHSGEHYPIRLIANLGPATAETEVSISVLGGPKLAAGPNPFSDSLIIFLGAEASNIEEISIYSAKGEKIWDKFSDSYNMESAAVVWKGVNNHGTKVASGVYLVYVRTGMSVHKLKVFKK